jgi:hypothetical protein
MPYKDKEKERACKRESARRMRKLHPGRYRRSVEENKIYYLKNKDRIRERGRSPEIRKRNTENHRKYVLKNKENVYAKRREWELKNRERCKEVNALWNKNNRLKLKSYWRLNGSKRRALKLSGMLPGYEKEIALIYRKSSIMTNITGVQYSVDHIWPLQGKQASGLHVPWNLQVMRLSENCQKHNSEPVGV